jgi:hypothetical protein
VTLALGQNNVPFSTDPLMKLSPPSLPFLYNKNTQGKLFSYTPLQKKLSGGKAGAGVRIGQKV